MLRQLGITEGATQLRRDSGLDDAVGPELNPVEVELLPCVALLGHPSEHVLVRADVQRFGLLPRRPPLHRTGAMFSGERDALPCHRILIRSGAMYRAKAGSIRVATSTGTGRTFSRSASRPK